MANCETMFQPEPSWRETRPYMGPDPKGSYYVYSLPEGADALTRANWDVITEALRAAAGLRNIPDISEPHAKYGPYTLDVGGAFGRATHLFLGPESPCELLEVAEDLMDRLADYPVLDEGRWSECQEDEAQQVWESLDLDERIRTIIEHNRAAPRGCEISVFAARKDTLPSWHLIGYGELADI